MLNTKIVNKKLEPVEVKAGQIRSDVDQYKFVLVVCDVGEYNAVDLVDNVGETEYRTTSCRKHDILELFPIVHDDVELNIYVGGRNE